LAKDLDQRSDLFALGLILYEMLTGKQPFFADSALASLIKRTQERAIPVSDIDNQIPGALSGSSVSAWNAIWTSATRALRPFLPISTLGKTREPPAPSGSMPPLNRWGGLFPGRSLQEL